MKYTCAGRFSRTFKLLSTMLFVYALAAPSARAADPADFAKKMTFALSETVLAKIGGSAFADFPVLVRLPAAASAEFAALKVGSASFHIRAFASSPIAA